MRHPRPSHERGFTLIEVIAAVTVGSILLAAMSSFYLAQHRMFRQEQIETGTSQALRMALEQIARDLRAAGLDPHGTADAGLTYADAGEIRFDLDADADGSIDASSVAEVRGFRWQGTTLETWIPGGGLTGWRPLATNVTSATFRYFRDDGSEVTSLPATADDRDAIRRVDVILTVGAIARGDRPIARTEAASIELRNAS